ncbi:MAG: serine hydrolase domain-containing protein [Acidimicrobiales bacterium]
MTTERIDDPGTHPTATPEEAGADPDKIDALLERAHREIDGGLLPSCQVALARHGRLIATRTIGDATPQTRYLVFSCTKVITAAALWLVIGERLVGRDTRVADVVPEFGTNGKDAVTVEHLLTHTSGFPLAPFSPVDWDDPERRLQRFAQWRLGWEPGTRFQYHPTSAHWVLAEILERVTGMDFREFVHSRLTEPFGLQRLRLGVSEDEQGDIAELVPVGTLPSAEELEAITGIGGLDPAQIGDVTEEELLAFNTPAYRRIGVPAGGAIGTAADMAMFLQALMENRDDTFAADVLHAGTAEVLCDLVDPMVGVASNRTLGLILAGDDGQSAMRGFGRTVTPAAFGHMGAGGQIAWADPGTGLSFTYVTNGLDRDPLNMGRRGSSLSNRAGVCAEP